MHRVAAASMVGLLMAAVQAGPGWSADAAVGRIYAERLCSSCHAIGTRGSDMVPPLETVANLPARNDVWFRAFLRNPHPPMPPLDLSTVDVDDLVAYLMSLRRR
jgi:mono/diheme cytochrome c family protein